MGELHLEIISHKLTRDMKIGVRIGKPRVAYKEAIVGVAEARGLHKKQTGGRGQYGDVVIRVEPFTKEQAQEEGLDFKGQIAFENKIFGGAIPKEYFPAIETGCREAAGNGVLAGFPIIGVKVTLIDGSYHEVDSSPIAFEQAALIAFKQTVTKARLQLLEPIMKVSATTPVEFLGAVTGDLNRRRAVIANTEVRGTTRVVTAEAPLAEMFGYATALRGMSQGRASYAMEPMTYRPVPRAVAKAVLDSVW